MSTLLQTAFSHPEVQPCIKGIYQSTKSYWEFCLVLDANWHELSPALRGKPKTRSKFVHQLNSGLPRFHKEPPSIIAAVPGNKAPRSHFVAIQLAKSSTSDTTGYPYQESSYSFISISLVSSLGLAPTPDLSTHPHCRVRPRCSIH